MDAFPKSDNCLLQIAARKQQNQIGPEEVNEVVQTDGTERAQEDLLKVLAFCLDIEVIYPVICIEIANKELILSEKELREFR